MTELIDSLTIRGFRGFSELTIPKLGQVNLLTGKNNAGKSSVLEAIRILVSRGSTDTLLDIQQYREAVSVKKKREFYGLWGEKLGFEPVRGLFHGFPDVLSTGPATFSIFATGDLPVALSSVYISTAWIEEYQDLDEEEEEAPAPLRYREVGGKRFGLTGGGPGLSVYADDRTSLRGMLQFLPTHQRAGIRVSLPGDSSGELVRYVYLDPFSFQSTSQLGELWDAIALTDVQDEVLKALQLVSPDIQAISMIGGESFGESASRTAIVRSSRFPNRIPLRSYGDGMNRLFGIILSLCNARNGILLIDEFENGLHYSVQPLVWQTIFQLAQDLDVQVFATTHSRDCVLAFQQAAAASPANGHLIRLTRKDDQVLPTVFSEDDLQLVADNDIEVR